MTDNNTLLTGQERKDYIKAHFTPDTTVPETLMIDGTVSPEFKKARVDFAAWYDAKDEDTQALIDEISDRTYYIIDEEDYDDFIETLGDYGITTVSDFEDAFEGEVEGYGERVYAEFAEQLVDSCGYLDAVPELLQNCIDYELVWYSALRYDYNAVEFNNNTYFLRNI